MTNYPAPEETPEKIRESSPKPEEALEADRKALPPETEGGLGGDRKAPQFSLSLENLRVFPQV